MNIKLKELKNFKNKKIVYTAGSFNLIHRGHIECLKAIKLRFPNHKIMVGVLSNRRVKAKKGNSRPIFSQRDRAILIDSIKYVDYTFVTPSNTNDITITVIKKLKPEYIVFPEKKYLKFKQKYLELGSHLIINSKHLSINSTSRIIKKIQNLNNFTKC